MKIAQFLQEVKLELSRVEWPTYGEFVGSLIVAFVVILFFALFLGVSDKVLAAIMKQIFIYGS